LRRSAFWLVRKAQGIETVEKEESDRHVDAVALKESHFRDLDA
jgi:hypothetical protein